MFSRIRYPEILEPEALDGYLATGWRCMGQAIYVSHFMFFPTDSSDQKVYSTLPTRLSLEGYSFRKSLRRLWRRNEVVFRIEAGAPAVFDKEKARVNSLYAASFPSRAIHDPTSMLETGSGGRAFDTREINLYYQDKLVAFSFFDLGKISIYSKQGIYDPAFSTYSPGFFTMLAEIAFGVEQGVQYYYPGYVVPGYPEFDYKHRVGPLEYFELSSGSWRPHHELREIDVPINDIRRQLSLLQSALAHSGANSTVLDYRYFDIRFYDNRPYPFLEYPAFLLAQPAMPGGLSPLAVYSPVRKTYSLYNCRIYSYGTSSAEAGRRLLKSGQSVCSWPIGIESIIAENLLLETAMPALLQHLHRQASS
ncbi:MAG: GNAT family N-acetyltransferase [Lewinellaceae bacterium]|nr:GNAT family N-acetyltransferase [Lewinellaceae bacterium]